MRLEALEGTLLAERFRLEKMIGQGGYGAVFEAIQLSVERRCAVKILLPNRSNGEQVEKRFRDEARATSRLTHPNSLVLYDFGVDDETGFLFLATEFLDGCTLHEVLEDKLTMEVGRTVSIMRQVAASLQDAHSLGLVHRDIKPKNVMLIDRAGQSDFVKVIDFGIAKALRGNLSRETDLTRTGMLIGTPQYMAPEQILGRELDGRVDQYVLAVLGYRMLTGRNPFRAGAPMETAMRHVNDRPLPLRTYRPELEVTAEFEDAFLRALEKSPEYRFERVLDFVDALQQAMDGGPQGDARGSVQVEQNDCRRAGDGDDNKAVVDVPDTGLENDSQAPQPVTVALTIDGEPQTADSEESMDVESADDSAEDEAVTTMMALDSMTRRQRPSEESSESDAEPMQQDTTALTRMARAESVEESRTETRRQISTESMLDDAQTSSKKRALAVMAMAAVCSTLLFSVVVVWGLSTGDGDDGSADGDRGDEVAEYPHHPPQGDVDKTTNGEDEIGPREADGTAGGDGTAEAKKWARAVEQGRHTIWRSLSAATRQAEQRAQKQPEEHHRETDSEHQPEASPTPRQAEQRAQKQPEEHHRETDSEHQPEASPTPRQATLTVTLIPWGTLYVDGEPVSDRTRQQVELSPGRHELTLRQKGTKRARQVVDVQGGESKMVVLEAEFD